MNKKLFSFMSFAGVAGAVLLIASNAYASGLYGVVSSTTGVQLGGNTSSSATVTASSSLNANEGLEVQLQAQAQSGAAMTSSSEDNIVQLQGNALAAIKTNDDLTAYNNLVVQDRPAVRSVNAQSDGSVSVGYSQPARFLGIFSTTLTGQVNVDAQGNVTVHMPWYAFLFSKDTTAMQTAATTAVVQSGAQFGGQMSTQAMVQNQAEEINAISAAVQAESQASASADMNASASGSGY
jgi:hypothetical protein